MLTETNHMATDCRDKSERKGETAMTVRAWLRKVHLLESGIVAVVLIVAVGGTALAAGPLGAAAKKKCGQTCQETKLFNSLYAAKIAKARVAFATTAGNAASAGSAGSATTAGTVTGTVGGAQVSGPVASATTAANATTATTATNVTGTVNGAQVEGTVADASEAANATSASSAGSVDGHTFTQIGASAGSGSDATLLDDFGGLTLQCVGPAGSEGTVTLAIVNSSPASGSFGAGEVDGAGAAHFDQGPVPAAVGGIPASIDFTFPIHSGAQVSFSYKSSAGGSTEVVSGTFTMTIDNGCSAFGNADASTAAG
jgi:hypothetical protein